MMTFFREEHEMFRKSVEQWLAKEIAPHVEEWERAELFPREVFKRAGELGFLGAHYPEDVGGAGGDWWYGAAWGEALVKSRCAGLAMALMVQTDMATPIIGELGTREQKEEFLAPALRGEKIAALGVSEPNCGSDVASIRTTARRVDGDYVINGAKCWITNGTRADFITLAVRTGAENSGFGGVSLVTFPTDTKGFSVTRKIKKMGNHSSDTAELSFEDCRIPARYLLGEENHGFYYIMMNFQGERLIAACSAVAGAQQCLDETIQYTTDRTAFGRPILKFQVWRHQFAQLATEIEGARWLTYRACDLFNRKEDAVKEITMAKLLAGELACKVADRCLQAHGGFGYSDEFPISRYYRDVRLVTIGGGTSEIMREIISKRLGWG
ncbi:MAG: acyl-CoA dehydrogenase family protein [Deltaproteobacteria bacterium]|nr:acyl-CoA dehydrogenase family protein [Deltaproteobacteria bacterium]